MNESNSSSIEEVGMKGASLEGEMAFPEGIHWSKPRREIRSWLKKEAPPLGELYEAAVEMVCDVHFPGRVHLISHAVREIRNRLPDFITGTKGKGRLDYVSRLNDVLNEWIKEFPLNSSPSSVTNSEDSSVATAMITISPNLYAVIGSLLSEHAEVSEKPVEAAIRLFEGCFSEVSPHINELRPIAKQWFVVTEKFMKKTHIPITRSLDNSFNEMEFRSQFEIFELTLASLAQGYFDTQEGIDDILDKANS